MYHAPPGYEIAGFCGRSANLVDAIGVVFRPLAERGLNTNTQAVALTPGVPTGGDWESAAKRTDTGGTASRRTDGEVRPADLAADRGTEPEEPMERSGGPIKPR